MLYTFVCRRRRCRHFAASAPLCVCDVGLHLHTSDTQSIGFKWWHLSVSIRPPQPLTTSCGLQTTQSPHKFLRLGPPCSFEPNCWRSKGLQAAAVTSTAAVTARVTGATSNVIFVMQLHSRSAITTVRTSERTAERRLQLVARHSHIWMYRRTA